MKKPYELMNVIQSKKWVQEQSIVKPCPKCGSTDTVANRYLRNHGSSYQLICKACDFKPKEAFSFSPRRGLKRALRRWNGSD